jgi:hypothetical protein
MHHMQFLSWWTWQQQQARHTISDRAARSSESKTCVHAAHFPVSVPDPAERSCLLSVPSVS